MFGERKTVTVTTDASGDGIDYISFPYGRVLSIIYTKVDFASGVDFAITVEDTGEGLWTEANVNASTFRYPRAAVQDIVGVAALYAATFPIVEPVFIVQDRIKIVVSSGGDVKTGTFEVVVG